MPTHETRPLTLNRAAAAPPLPQDLPPLPVLPRPTAPSAPPARPSSPLGLTAKNTHERLLAARWSKDLPRTWIPFAPLLTRAQLFHAHRTPWQAWHAAGCGPPSFFKYLCPNFASRSLPPVCATGALQAHPPHCSPQRLPGARACSCSHAWRCAPLSSHPSPSLNSSLSCGFLSLSQSSVAAPSQARHARKVGAGGQRWGAGGQQAPSVGMARALPPCGARRGALRPPLAHASTCRAAAPGAKKGAGVAPACASRLKSRAGVCGGGVPPQHAQRPPRAGGLGAASGAPAGS